MTTVWVPVAQGTQNVQETTPWAQNIHKGVAYDVSARSGGVRRALMPPKDRFWCPIDHQKQGVDSPESKTQNDPLKAVGHAATPPNVQAHHRQPLCGCSVP